VAGASTDLSAGYGAYLLHTALALVAVCALAALVLALLRRRVGAGSRALRVVARLPLEPRRALYLVEAAGKFLLLGVGEGPMTTLAELDAADVARALAEDEAPSSAGLVELMRRALGGRAK
jgi:flagellar biosynthetic protein FliO